MDTGPVPEELRRVREIFAQAADLPEDERGPFLERVCAGNSSLRKQVEVMLATDEPKTEVLAGAALAASHGTHAMSSEASPTLEPGSLLGDKYVVEALLGRGGMGEVYRARDVRLDRKVAVKVLPRRLAGDPERLRRFEFEARAAGRLSHPNVVAVFDIGMHEGAPYVVSELLEGEDVRYLMAGEPLEPRRAVEIAIGVARGVAAAHAKGLVHRDLKPENVFVTSDGQVKVLDFGVAKLVETEIEGATAVDPLTESGVVLGTIGYMSPEQVCGEALDGRSDVFAFGALLYEMLTGRYAFYRRTAGETIAAILEPTLPPIEAERGPLPPGLEDAVRRCVQRAPEDRFQSATEVAEELERILAHAAAGEPVHVDTAARAAATGRRSVATSSEPTATASVRRETLLRAGAAAVVVAVLGATAYLFTTPGDPVPEPAASVARSIAVLPFAPLVAAAADEALEMGMADALISKLGGIGEITVRPIGAVRRYAGLDQDPVEAGRQLGVDAVLSGSIQRAGDRLRVSVRLIRVRDGASLWAETFDMRSSDTFELQDRLAQQVATRLQFRLSSSEQARLAKRFTTSPTAFDYYLRGMHRFDKRSSNTISKGDTLAAIDYFRKAIAEDPNYALAHAQLAYCYTWMALFIDPDPKWLELAKATISHAYALDPNLAELHVVRYEILWSQYEGFEIEEAIRELRLAQQLNPSVGHSELATLYYHLGLEEAALRELARALEIDPTSDIVKSRTVEGNMLLVRIDEAISANAGFYDEPGPPMALIWANRFDEAEREIGKRLETNPRDFFALGARARLWAAKGRFAAAEADFARIVDSAQASRSYHHATYDVACVYALQGKAGDAVEWLKKTADAGMPNYLLFERDPHLNPIRSDPAFAEFLAGIRARWERLKREFE